MKPLTAYDKHAGKPYLRWTANERMQHWLLAGSFIILAVTGFALKYPQAWWVRPFFGPEWLFDLRSLLHRIAGSVFTVLGVYHFYYMVGTLRGRQLLAAFRLRMQDLRDARQNISFNLGLRKAPPAFDHFNYTEKFEYWALIWGAFIMTGTGLMLWFEETTMRLLPRWVIDLLTVIHLYEAWLATLAIVVWHFYAVIFSPQTYPLNTSMLDGRMSEAEMLAEHGLEWEALKAGMKPQSAEQDETADLRAQTGPSQSLCVDDHGGD